MTWTLTAARQNGARPARPHCRRHPARDRRSGPVLARPSPSTASDLADRALDLVRPAQVRTSRRPPRAADLTMMTDSGTALRRPYAGGAHASATPGQPVPTETTARLPYWSLDIAHVLHGRPGGRGPAIPSGHAWHDLDQRAPHQPPALGLVELLRDVPPCSVTSTGAAAAVAASTRSLPAGFPRSPGPARSTIAAGGELSHPRRTSLRNTRPDERGGGADAAGLAAHDAARLGATGDAADLADATARCRASCQAVGAQRRHALAARPAHS
ncbi:hypothetical protein HBB16_19575 [Pseudonocardia sp. MCCB 268]|nr:hypothetical protein [Pseudonocardia cytotoxica]